MRAGMEFLPQTQVGIEKTGVFKLKSQSHLGTCTTVEPVGKTRGLAGEERHQHVHFYEVPPSRDALTVSTL